MQTLENTLAALDFKAPNFTQEQLDRMNKDAVEFEREQAAQKTKSRIQHAGIPHEFADAKISRADVANWTLNPGYGLLLQGLPGRGKTYEGAAALHAMASCGTIRFTTFKQLIDECKKTFNGVESEYDVISRCKNCGCLMVDDMGSEYVTQYSLPIIFEIIDSRGASSKPTIITTNYTGDELMKRLTLNGDSTRAKAIISRMSRYERVVVEGVDRRRECRTPQNSSAA